MKKLTSSTEKFGRLLNLAAFGVGTGEIMAAQVPMILPYTTLRDAIFTHTTLTEGLINLFNTVPPA